MFDIIPCMAAPHSTSINVICGTSCSRWIFTGGEDGYIRKFDLYASMNGKVSLTVAQRHPFVDSVVRAGVLLNYWENEDTSDSGGNRASNVFALACQSDGLWLLSGVESGGINLQTLRFDEGKIITVLKQHTLPISVLSLSSDEKTVLSGSWDKTVVEWDLNNGQPKRTFNDQRGQISSVFWRPQNASIAEVDVPRYVPSLQTNNNGLGNKKDSKNGILGSPGSDDSFDSLFDLADEENEEIPAFSEPKGNEEEEGEEEKENPKESEATKFTMHSSDVFMAGCIDGSTYIWDRRAQRPVSQLEIPKGTPPWSMSVRRRRRRKKKKKKKKKEETKKKEKQISLN